MPVRAYNNTPLRAIGAEIISRLRLRPVTSSWSTRSSSEEPRAILFILWKKERQLPAAAGGAAAAEGRPVTFVESVTFTVLPSVVVSLTSEKVQSFASAMLPAVAA